jgi:hypothetical protein
MERNSGSIGLNVTNGEKFKILQRIAEDFVKERLMKGNIRACSPEEHKKECGRMEKTSNMYKESRAISLKNG